MQKILIPFLVFVLAPAMYINCYAQLGDIARIDYTSIPESDSDFGFDRIRVLFNAPIKLKKEGTYLLLGLDYSNIDVTMNGTQSFNQEELNDFQILDFNIGYTTPLKNDWRLGFRITPGLSSNLSARDFNLRDIVISSDLVFIKDKTKQADIKKPWRLIVGLSFSGNRGFPFPLPFISYYEKFHEKWSYNVGIPKTNLQYHLAKKHRLKLIAELDGFTSNLQQGIVLENNTVAESINMSLIVAGLQYEYHIAKHVEFFAKSSFILSNSIRLRDDDRDRISELDNSNTLYLRTGIRLKI